MYVNIKIIHIYIYAAKYQRYNKYIWYTPTDSGNLTTKQKTRHVNSTNKQ